MNFLTQDNAPASAFLSEPLTVELIGAPVNAGQNKTGTEKGPASIRATPLISAIEHCGWKVLDKGDITFEEPADDPPNKNGARRPRACGNASKAVHDAVYDTMKDGKFAVVMGGDHSIAAGSISAALRVRPETVVIWVDAHTDINTDKSSPSGNIHGMPVALLMRLIELNDMPGWEWMIDTPELNKHQIIYIALRDVDPGEKEILRKFGIKGYSMHDVDKHNIGPVMDRVLKDIDPYGTKPIHVSFDIDGLDPSIAPSTGTPVVGGLTFREGAYICEVLADTQRVCSMDVVEVNPDLAKDEAERKATADAAKRVIACVLGECLLWGTQPHFRPPHGPVGSK